MSDVAVTGIGEAIGEPSDSLETLIFRSARAALAEAGLTRDDLDGVVLAASDQTDGRAISSMLTSGPAGAYLNDEINAASSPGHALALGYMQILSGTHRRVLVSSWGKGSETKTTVQAAERLSAEPFFERDGGTSSLAAAAVQAERHRAGDPDRHRAAAQVAARNHGDRSAEEVAASDMVALPLRALELPPETDGAYSVVLAAGDDGLILSGVGWRSDGARIAERDLVGLPHLGQAAADAYRRAGLDGARSIGSVHLHDYTPDAEILAYVPLGLCGPGEELELALSGDDRPINPGGGSVRGEAPFGGPLRKLLEAVRVVRAGTADRALAHMTTGFAGQFQTVAIVEGRS
jgi:acetyl-CoA C-acetyltransferase